MRVLFEKRGTVCVAMLFLLAGVANSQIGEYYRKPGDVYTRWSSFENPWGRKGLGGMTNKGAKGHPFEPLEAGEEKILMDIEGSGIITRMWFTVNDLTTPTLRALKLDIFWDGAATPAVSVPFGDFFGAIMKRRIAYENALFSNPEGRSFNCYIPMPFRKGAKVAITNESDEKVRLLFYDIDYTLGVKHPKDVMYFHSCWRRENPSTLGKDFTILPTVKGEGRFLGCIIAVAANQDYIGWWGEGEVKMYLDGDDALPTICGTGTEDYIGTGWGQGEYVHRYHGSLVSDKENGLYVFYRYHIPDPVYFDKDIRVTIQQMGGDAKKNVVKMLDEGILPMIPVTISTRTSFTRLLEKDPPLSLKDPSMPPTGWANYYREDDVCAVAYFYLESPENLLPPLAPISERLAPSGKSYKGKITR